MYIYLGKKHTAFTNKEGETVSGYNLYFAREFAVSGELEAECYIPCRRPFWLSESRMAHIHEPAVFSVCEPVFNEYGRLVCIRPIDD